MKVHGRVSDIWRSYIAQTILWKLNMTVAMIPPVVTQYRNAHEYLADFDAELDLYQKSHSMISVLSAYSSNIGEVSIPKMYETLMIELFERGFIEEMDIKLTQEWMKALCKIR